MPKLESWRFRSRKSTGTGQNAGEASKRIATRHWFGAAGNSFPVSAELQSDERHANLHSRIYLRSPKVISILEDSMTLVSVVDYFDEMIIIAITEVQYRTT